MTYTLTHSPTHPFTHSQDTHKRTQYIYLFQTVAVVLVAWAVTRATLHPAGRLGLHPDLRSGCCPNATARSVFFYLFIFLSVLPGTSVWGHLLRNIHPLLQDTSPTLIHTSLYDYIFFTSSSCTIQFFPLVTGCAFLGKKESDACHSVYTTE